MTEPEPRTKKSFKSFFEKAKSTFEKANAPPAELVKQKTMSAQITSLEFTLSGGPLHTDLLMATAIARGGGELAGQQLPLLCRWFTINNNNEIREIEGVTGAFYQPCADDVGSKISVSASPTHESGIELANPVTAEVGPLILDRDVEKRATALLDSDPCFAVVKIDSVNFLHDKEVFHLPGEGRIEIDVDSSIISLKAQNLKTGVLDTVCASPVTFEYPKLVLNKKTNSNQLFDMFFSATETVKLIAPGNVERDMITIAVRMFCAQKLLERQLNQNNSSLQDIKDEEKPEHKASMELDHSSPNLDPLKKSSSQPEEENVIKLTENAIINPVAVDSSNSISGSLSNINTAANNTASPLIIPPTPVNNTNASVPQQHPEKVSGQKKMGEFLNVELVMKMEQLNKDIAKLTKDKDQLSHDLDNERMLNRRVEQQQKETQNSLTVANNSLQVMIEENEKITKENDKLVSEKLFFQQEINLYKTQTQDLKDLLEYHENKDNETGEKKPMRRISVEKNAIRDKYDAIIIELRAQISVFDNQNSDLKSEMERLKDMIGTLTQEKEDLDYQNNHLNKKYQSLVQEKSLNRMGTDHNLNVNISSNQNLSQPASQHQSPVANIISNHISNHDSDGGGKNNSDPNSGIVSPKIVYQGDIMSGSNISAKENNAQQPDFNSNSVINKDSNGQNEQLTDKLQLLEERQKHKEKVISLEEEVRFLKEHIQRLNITNETLKISKEPEDKKSPSKKGKTTNTIKSSKVAMTANLEYLQKLANSLTETIAEKGIALEDQRKINKELGKRVTELEDIIRSLQGGQSPDKIPKITLQNIHGATLKSDSAADSYTTRNEIFFNFKN
jgi:hypothetical protein